MQTIFINMNPHQPVFIPPMLVTSLTQNPFWSFLPPWAEADLHFQENLVPAVVSEPSIQAKNRILCDGIYTYFSKRYGTKQPKTDRNTKRRLAKTWQSTEESEATERWCQKKFQRAKREGLQPETIQSLARNFFKLVREHNQLKRTSCNASIDESMAARSSCLDNVRRYCIFNKDAAALFSNTVRYSTACYLASFPGPCRTRLPAILTGYHRCTKNNLHQYIESHLYVMHLSTVCTPFPLLCNGGEWGEIFFCYKMWPRWWGVCIYAHFL